MKVPCITLRDETRWTETVESDWNVLAGADTAKIVELARACECPAGQEVFLFKFYGRNFWRIMFFMVL